MSRSTKLLVVSQQVGEWEVICRRDSIMIERQGWTLVPGLEVGIVANADSSSASQVVLRRSCGVAPSVSGSDAASTWWSRPMKSTKDDAIRRKRPRSGLCNAHAPVFGQIEAKGGDLGDLFSPWLVIRMTGQSRGKKD